MSTRYSEIPDNYDEIKSILITDYNEIEEAVFSASSCFFYDACSIQFHSNVNQIIQEKISNYFISKGGILLITKCVLMELGGLSHILQRKEVNYLKFLSSRNIKIILFDEKYIYDLLATEYQNSKVNEIFKFAVRAFNSKASIFHATFDAIPELQPILHDVEIKNDDLCLCFFSEVLKNKEEGDNLGEELIGVCVFMLLYLTGEESGKFTVISDDTSGSIKINKALQSIPVHITNKKALILSTPRFTQYMIKECFIDSITEIEEILSSCKIDEKYILALGKNDLFKGEYKHTAHEWAELLLMPNEVTIML